MDKRLHILVAGDHQDSILPSLWRTLAYSGFIERRSVSAVGFCRADDGALIVVLPKAFSHPTTRARLHEQDLFRSEHVFRLIRVFRKILYDTDFTQEVIDSTAAKAERGRAIDPVLESLESAIRLRADFRRNGLWVPKRRSLVVNAETHPVAWPATVRRGAPLIEKDSILFLETVHHRRLKDSSNLFYMLHAYALRHIFTLTGEKHIAAEVPAVDASALIPVLRNPTRYFRTFHREIFTDRGRTLLGYLEAHFGTGTLQITSQRLRDDALSYTATFETLWEFVLAGLFGSAAKAPFKLPQGVWVSWPSECTADGVAPRADLVVERPALSILDAKDYRIINGAPLVDARLGSPDDHYKQIIYRTLLQTDVGSPIINMLAFPSVEQGQLFLLRGCHYWQSLPASPVFEISVDYDLAIKRWLGETSLDVEAEFKTLLADVGSLAGTVKSRQPALSV